MTLLHDYFHTRNLQAFQRLLDGSAGVNSSSYDRGSHYNSGSNAAPSSSPGSSWTPGRSARGNSVMHGSGSSSNNNNNSGNIEVNVNARDWLGRTVLQLVCASPESSSIEYARALLKHPSIDVNLADTESMWTPLHRALYTANLPVALLLLQRSDIDAGVKDAEGYTAIDLYNSTVNGTKPDPAQRDAELYTWGANKNAALGLADADDRVHPDRVLIKPAIAPPAHPPLSVRFAPIPVRQVCMSKLHTVVVTGESEGNVRVCGFGSGGRLGASQHMQYALKPLPALSAPSPGSAPAAFSGSSVSSSSFASSSISPGTTPTPTPTLPSAHAHGSHPQIQIQIASVAVGQDHTLALTTSGDVYSWGLNRFAQLGYIVESSSNSSSTSSYTYTPSSSSAANANAGAGSRGYGYGQDEEQIQSVPKRVVGVLRREVVAGVAASRNASACWTRLSSSGGGGQESTGGGGGGGGGGVVYTWGTNTGQLGYDRHAQPVQVLPKQVTRLSAPVVGLAMSDTVLVALLVTHHVECIWNDRHYRVSFPTHAFPSGIEPYRPPHSIRDSWISKVTGCEDMFAALSSNGEVFTFSAPSGDGATVSGESGGGGGGRAGSSVFRPQRVWALRRKFSAVKDVALGADGSIIICTESGHVFVRTRNVPTGISITSSSSSSPSLYTTPSFSSGGGSGGAGGKAFKFTRVPFLQRVVKVCANASGAFGALRVEYRPRGVDAHADGRSFGEEIRRVRPFVVSMWDEEEAGKVVGGEGVQEGGGGDDDDGDGKDLEGRDKANAKGKGNEVKMKGVALDADEQEEGGVGIEGDVTRVLELCDVLLRQQQKQQRVSASQTQGQGQGPNSPHATFDLHSHLKSGKLPYGADAVVHVHSFAFPVHSVLLAARSGVLQALLQGEVPGDSISEADGRQGVWASVKLLPSLRVPNPNSSSHSNSNPSPGVGQAVSRIMRLEVKGCHHPLTVMVLLHYLYADEVLAVWDRRIGGAEEVQRVWALLSAGAAGKSGVGTGGENAKGGVKKGGKSANANVNSKVDGNASATVNPTRVRQELQLLAKMLDLPALSAALEAPVKREPAGTLARDMKRLFDAVQVDPSSSSKTALRPDVILQLADREVRCHSFILRARSPLFESFFGLEDWTRNRWGEDGIVRVDMRHMSWDVVRFVTGYMCCGQDEEMFWVLDFVNSVEELVQFMFQVLAAANELLLDRLVLLCSSVILAHTNISNACYILADASHYHVQPLIASLHEYIAVNMESFLIDNRILDDLPHALVKQLAHFVRARQVEKTPFARGGEFVEGLMEKYKVWLENEDVPDVAGFVRAASAVKPLKRDFSKAAPQSQAKGAASPATQSRTWSVLGKNSTAASSTSSLSKTAVEFTPRQTLRRPPSGEDIFAMDDHSDSAAYPTIQESGNKLAMPMTSPAAGKSPAVWKAAGAPRVDMKAVMAEAASQSQSATSSSRPATTNKPSQAGSSGPGLTTPSKQAMTRQPSGSGPPLTWRINADPNAAPRGLPSTPPSTSVFASGSPKDGMANARLGAGAGVVTVPSSASKVQQGGAPLTPARPAQTPGLGPVITPTRQTSSSKVSLSTHRNAVAFVNVSGGKAWSQSQPFGPPPTSTSTSTTTTTSSPSAPTKGVSFLAIQNSQLEATPVRDKRTLREIQDEERELQAEADFMMWWTAEEQRVRAEQEREALALAQFQSNANANGNASGSKKSRKPKPRGPPKPKSDAAAAGGASALTPTSGKPEAGSSSAPPQGSEGAGSTHTPRRRPHKPRQKSHADP